MATKQYVVLNPRGIPTGVPIFRRDDGVWREGDTFERPAAMSKGDVDGLVDRGFLKEVAGG